MTISPFTKPTRGAAPSGADPAVDRAPAAAWVPHSIAPRGWGGSLHISAGEGARHMRRVLAEAGIQTETRGAWRDRRTYVVAVGRVEV